MLLRQFSASAIICWCTLDKKQISLCKSPCNFWVPTALLKLAWNTQQSTWTIFFLSTKARCFLILKKFWWRPSFLHPLWPMWVLKWNIYLSLFLKKIGIHSMQGRTATTRHGITRKRSKKRLKHTGNISRKNLQVIDVC